MLCFLLTHILRFVLLPYYRRNMFDELTEHVMKLKLSLKFSFIGKGGQNKVLA